MAEAGGLVSHAVRLSLLCPACGVARAQPSADPHLEARQEEVQRAQLLQAHPIQMDVRQPCEELAAGRCVGRAPMPLPGDRCADEHVHLG